MRTPEKTGMVAVDPVLAEHRRRQREAAALEAERQTLDAQLQAAVQRGDYDAVAALAAQLKGCTERTTAAGATEPLRDQDTKALQLATLGDLRAATEGCGAAAQQAIAALAADLIALKAAQAAEVAALRERSDRLEAEVRWLREAMSAAPAAVSAPAAASAWAAAVAAGPLVIDPGAAGSCCPCGLAVDGAGGLLVSDDTKHRVLRIGAPGAPMEVVAGGNGRGDAGNQLLSPRGLDVDADGAVLIADWGNHRVLRWPQGAARGAVVAGGNGKGDGRHQLNLPVDVQRHRPTGALFVADNNNSVVRWDPGARVGVVVATLQSCPWGLAVLGNGDLLVADTNADRILLVGNAIGAAAAPTVVATGPLSRPAGIANDERSGLLFVADTDSHRVQRVALAGPNAGAVATAAGGAGQGAGPGQLNQPWAVHVRDGVMFVCDTGNRRVLALAAPPGP